MCVCECEYVCVCVCIHVITCMYMYVCEDGGERGKLNFHIITNVYTCTCILNKTINMRTCTLYVMYAYMYTVCKHTCTCIYIEAVVYSCTMPLCIIHLCIYVCTCTCRKIHAHNYTLYMYVHVYLADVLQDSDNIGLQLSDLLLSQYNCTYVHVTQVQ